MIFDLNGFCRDEIRPGANHNINGPRGNGKTYLAMALAENLIKGNLPCATEHVAVFMNVAIERRIAMNGTDDDFVDAYPPGVKPFRTFVDLLKELGKSLRKYGMGKVTNVVILDEAQNYMLSDQNSSAENQAIVKFMGNARKFGVCTFFMTPTRKNLVPRIRGFEDSAEAGYCTVEWRKDKVFAQDYLRKYPSIKADPKDIATVRMSDDDDPIPVWVPNATWTKSPETAKVGDYIYQTLAAADFSVGHNVNGVEFEIEDFMRYVSGKNFRRLPLLIEEYFDDFDTRVKLDKKGNIIEPTTARLTKNEIFLQKHSQQCEAIDYLRSIDVPLKELATAYKEDEGTIRSRYNKFFELFPERKVSRKIETASKSVKRDEVGSGPPVYIQPSSKGEAFEEGSGKGENIEIIEGIIEGGKACSS